MASEATKSSRAPLLHEDMRRVWPEEDPHPTTPTPDLGLPASRMVSNEFLSLITPPPAVLGCNSPGKPRHSVTSKNPSVFEGR